MIGWVGTYSAIRLGSWREVSAGFLKEDVVYALMQLIYRAPGLTAPPHARQRLAASIVHPRAESVQPVASLVHQRGVLVGPAQQAGARNDSLQGQVVDQAVARHREAPD